MPIGWAEFVPDLDLFLRICRALNATPNDLLGVHSLPNRQGNDHFGTAPTALPEPAAFELAEIGPHGLRFQAIAWDICSGVVRLRQD